MGVCLSTDLDRKRNAEIEGQLKRDKKMAEYEAKMLLLGAGESGKSTILKQMKLIHSNGYTDQEKAGFREIIFTNIIQSMKVIVEAMKNLEIEVGDPADGPLCTLIENAEPLMEGGVFSAELAHAIKVLWQDKGILEAFERSSEYQLNDSAQYFFDSIDRISAPHYLPTDQDILRSRVKTTGIIETSFTVDKFTYRMFDVGGQRSERKKWIHCFENVTAIVFLVAISEYDQVLIEDETVNRMQEALTLFDSICNSRWFVKTSIILFLNKIDLFESKIRRVPIEDYFVDYEGGDDLEAGKAYFKERFTELNNHATRKIYAHFTCGTDTSNVKFVMNSVNDIIQKKILSDLGLI